MDTRRSFSPALEPLWRAVHKRLSSGQPVSRVSVGPLSDEGREALADLLGRDRLPPVHATVSLSALEDAVGNLRAVVTDQIGPIGDRAEDIRQGKGQKDRLWDWLVTHPVLEAQPALKPWAAATRKTGLIGGTVETTRAELEKVLKVLRALPATGVPLPVFADTVLSDPHALDDGKRRTVLVAKALAAIFDVPAPEDAASRKALWKRAGVSDDELSSTVLVGGLSPTGPGLAAAVLRACAGAGDAASLTLRQLRHHPLRTGLPPVAWVFENPSVIALALERFGRACPPLVCTSGWPSSAGILLLQQLRDAGTTVYYHGDFDGEGLRIAASVVARIGAVPWHLTTADYTREADSEGPPVGHVTPVPWDDGLGAELARRGVTVPEERVAEALLDELAVQTVGDLV
ncbi:TIGR02679 family protein [Kribbella sp. NPDC026611]|uniref:TIGR02679 family protein n=1 Tax=Kribbella sp. NPDC026611 TaxID=3154911 RepID=UPI0033C5BA61